MEGNSLIINADCLSVLREMDGESVDLVLTDPPYGINFHSNHRTKSTLKSTGGILNDGKDNSSFLAEVIKELYRVARNNTHIYWFTRWDKVAEHLPLLKEYFNIKNALIWKKNNWSMGDLQGAYAGQYEVILFAQKGRRILNKVDGRKRHTDILEYARVPSQRLRHSHEKPEELIEFLIRKSSNPSDLILDPFAGSGTTAAVAKRLAREFVTIEADIDFYNIAVERVKAVTSEGKATE